MLSLLPSSRRAVRHTGELRFLSGTLEEMAAVFLTEGEALRPGATALVELRCRGPVVVRDGDPFIVRTSNARETIGGGRVVSRLDGPLGRRDPERRRALVRRAEALGDPARMVRTALDQAQVATVRDLAVRCQLTPVATEEILKRLETESEVVPMWGGRVAPSDAVRRAADALRKALEALHRERPLVAALPVAEVRDRAGLDDALLGAAVELLGSEAVLEGRTVRLASHRVRIDPETARAAETLLGCLEQGRFAPPESSRIGEATGLGGPAIEAAFALLFDRGEVREVAPGLCYPKKTLDEGVRLLGAVARKRGPFEPVDAKAAFGGISRKWLIPLLEYYDRLGATRRDGNARILTRRGEAMAEGGIDAT
jgi:selenocysteine-specific elongation factor